MPDYSAPAPFNKSEMICYGAALLNMSSSGILENYETPNIILNYSLPLLEMQIFLIFIFIVFSHMFLRSIGIPQFVSYMVAGFILGPQLIDLLGYSSEQLSLDPTFNGNLALEALAKVGLIMFIFLMTVKANKRAAFTTDKRTIIISISSSLITLLIGLSFRNYGIESFDPLYIPFQMASTERTVIVTIQSLTLLPAVTHLLSELKIPNSELGRLAISIATINDILGFINLCGISYVATYQHVSFNKANVELAAIIGLILVSLFIVKPIAQWIIDNTQEGKPVRTFYLYGIVLIAFGGGIVASVFNQIIIVGPFLVGLAIPDGPPLGSAFEGKFEGLVKNGLFPISIVVMTMKGDLLRVLYSFDDIFFNIVLVVMTSMVKWLSSFIPCLFFKLPMRESIILATIMSCRGYLDLCLLEISREKEILTEATHTFMIIYVLINAGILPTVIQSLYDPKRKYIGYSKKTIMHLKPNSDLKILTCIHKPDNISGSISLLQLISSPFNTKDKGIVSITAVHLVKLLGRAFPILVPHDKNSKAKLLQNSYIQTMMLEFTHLQQENFESISVNSFTSFSQNDLMDQDICVLALDQLTSMILVPSGRKWSRDGLYESDDDLVRRVNVSLLEAAPCSVAVLNYRGYSKGFLRNKKEMDLLVNVGMIFIGGKDDREGLCLAKWMRENPRVRLSVIRFKFEGENGEIKNQEEEILDEEVLNDVKGNCYEDFVYVEKIVKDGVEVVSEVRVLSEDYDLMIVGRDHCNERFDFCGLVEWMEMPELGVIGDLLVSKDLETRVSVLVVQQQRQHVYDSMSFKLGNYNYFD